MFLKVNKAYEFLEIEDNRRIYLNHIKAIEEKNKRFEAMDETRKRFAEDLKRR